MLLFLIGVRWLHILASILLAALFSTEFGHLWLVRLVIGILFGIRFWMLERTSRGRSVPAVSLACLAGIELVSLAWGGHAVALTGLLNSAFMVGNPRVLLTSDYGRLLISKVVLFLFMVGLGAWNLLLLKPSLTVDAQAMNVAHQRRAIRALLRNVLLEIVLGAAVILIVATLGVTPPPMR
jgi:putative copper resistance protein D